VYQAIEFNDKSLPKFCRLPGAAGLNFFGRPGDLAAIFDAPHGNSLMHCTKQEGDPGV
jgi:hypothetical protein